MATLTYTWSGDSWVRYGRNSVVPDRDDLIGGMYVPSAATTGPISALTDMYATAGAALTATKGLGAGYVTLSAGSYENMRIWAQVRWSGDVTLRNCEIVGPDPTAPPTATAPEMYGLLRNFNAASSHATLIDCRLTAAPWNVHSAGRPLASGETRTYDPRNAGLHGGNVSFIRCEITGVQDGINYVQNGWVVGTSNSYCLIDRSWIHGLPYQNNWTGPGSPSNEQTHNDCFQPNNGKNITIKHSMLGGWREQSGYDVWPGGANTGDDAFSSILQLQQEINDTESNRLENVTIQENWIYGGQYGINMYWKSTRPSQDFSTFTVTGNRFVQRPAGVRWGPSLNDPHESNPANMNGNYFNKSPNAVPTITGNVIVASNDMFTSLGTIPISNAGNG